MEEEEEEEEEGGALEQPANCCKLLNSSGHLNKRVISL